MNLQKVLFAKENKYISYNEEEARLFLREFQYIIKKDLTKKYNKDYTYLQKFLLLWNDILYNYPNYKDIFYTLLIENNFNLFLDIILRLQKPIKDLVLSPLIQNISVNSNGLVTVFSNKIGEFSFTKLKNYYSNNPKIIDFLKTNRLNNNCHYISWKFMSFINNSQLITILLPSYFIGTLFHSLIQDEHGMYIDIARNIAYDEESFKLLNSKIVSTTTKEEMIYKLNFVKSQIDKKTKQEYYHNALLIALYEESKKI